MELEFHHIITALAGETLFRFAIFMIVAISDATVVGEDRHSTFLETR